MSGFKSFVLKGDLVSLAVGFIVGTAFATVVTTFTNWLTAQLPAGVDNIFTNKENSFGAFMNATIAFLILAAVVYFFVVMPYTRAKEKWFPAPEPDQTEVEVLAEIRDLLASANDAQTPGGSHRDS